MATMIHNIYLQHSRGELSHLFDVEYSLYREQPHNDISGQCCGQTSQFGTFINITRVSSGRVEVSLEVTTHEEDGQGDEGPSSRYIYNIYNIYTGSGTTASWCRLACTAGADTGALCSSGILALSWGTCLDVSTQIYL